MDLPAGFAAGAGTGHAANGDRPVATGTACATQPAAPALSQAELEQILAPIALYPDDLLTQVLVASTYPLEVVMAEPMGGTAGLTRT